MGLGTAVQNATSIAWAIPRNSRPNPILLRVRGLLIVAFGGLAVLGLTTASVLVSNTTLIAWFEASPLRWLARVVSVLVTGGLLFVLMRLSAARPDRQRTTLPGAMLTAVLWHLLQQVGAVYVTHVLAGADTVNATFGLVLGLMAAFFLVSVAGMLGVELNVVLDRHLWPRALLTPFTDSVRLTEADRRAYRGYAAAQRHKGFETVTVDFGDDPDDDQERRILGRSADLALRMRDDELVGHRVHDPSEGLEVLGAGDVDQVVAHAVDVHRRHALELLVTRVGHGADDAAAVLGRRGPQRPGRRAPSA